jgi:glycerol-3-phosphate acyltransferase PlsY
MEAILAFVVLPAACYFCGAIPFGWLIGKAHGIEIREHGSKNVGATNVGRVLGRRWGLLTFALDVAKGALPVLAVPFVLGDRLDSEALYQLSRVLCAFAAVAGHLYTFWLGFKGGKGVATALGAIVAIWPEFTWAGLAAFGVWLAVVAISRYVSLASITAAAAFPLAYLGWLAWAAWGAWAAWQNQVPLMVFSVLTAVLIIVKHRANIARLLAGTEPKIGGLKPQA